MKFILEGSGKTLDGREFSDELHHADTLQECIDAGNAILDAPAEFNLEYVSAWVVDQNGKTVKEL